MEPKPKEYEGKAMLCPTCGKGMSRDCDAETLLGLAFFNSPVPMRCGHCGTKGVYVPPQLAEQEAKVLRPLRG